MVLTEAFAAGTPVVASDIPGYRDVVEHGGDGLLVPPGDPLALAETLHDLALDPARLERLGERAGRSAERYAWPRVAARVIEAYEDAIAMPEPASAAARFAVRYGLRSAAGGPRRPARRLPSLEPRASRLARAARRGAAGRARRRRRSRRRAARGSPSSASAGTRSRRPCSPRAPPGCCSRSR